MLQAETSRLPDLVIHSLQTRPEVFLRELVANASDARDRLRRERLVPADLIAGEDAPLQVWIEVDAAARTLTVRDHGIGRSRDEGAEEGSSAEPIVLNSMKPIWTRREAAVTPDEYAEFDRHMQERFARTSADPALPGSADLLRGLALLAAGSELPDPAAFNTGLADRVARSRAVGPPATA